MTIIPDYARPGVQPRFCKQAVVAFFLSLLPALGAAFFASALNEFRTAPKQGWDGFGQFLGLVFTGLGAIVGGSIFAVIAVLQGRMALSRMQVDPHELSGRRTAWSAVIIGYASLALGWGSIATVAAVHSIERVPYKAAERDIRLAFGAVADFADHHKHFPETLEQVAPPTIARRYVYLGLGLPGKYCDGRTDGRQRIVLMHTRQSVHGKFIAICVNGMTREWTKSELDTAISGGLGWRVAHEP